MSGLVIFGTRPEAIKLAPMVASIRDARSAEDVGVVCTGQHAEIMTQTLNSLDLDVDENLNLMQRDQTPMEVVERIIVSLTERYASERPDWVLVQGDTATAFAGALFGYLGESTVIHLEAGLRTHDIHEPWPEEGFRQEIARLAGLHLAPFPCARENLLAEGIGAESIQVVGNTGLDGQQAMLAQLDGDDAAWLPDGDFVLVTMHRRENIGPRLEATCRQLVTILDNYPDLRILWPVHPNPKVRSTAFQFFGDRKDRVMLSEPLDYPKFLHAQRAAKFVVSDSGGVQEEAASLGTRVAIVREKTERPDAVDLGLTRIVSADASGLVDAVNDFMATPVDPASVAEWRALQGDGNAGEAAAAALLKKIENDQAVRQRA
ncbi:MAG: UDP-N-acetylglucosamine 2-epimerase (non-hydrolyzing) [Rhodospirillaceae bacterium]|jgi:UDP-N-acetylglucosamine 2-epimerase (non-hydrolysing)|nr:UDP-N-acetylglucosamine 2-epimerase (non-hydrolyzing) [Rhodospirillaceae bacterium]MBT6403583.1 UDP-N-acetylglucosamine 2-epimerase (non-hydrolyzing) [Rhodospirillaceae bacterium]MBT6535461.1 UDP-N-acetylglucosamine 2-epimerase (non-hydrolyzing) [Rhodospirillaceae bacterium]MBT7362524.1 UDP-N-acetylglucosamine 2-epimerase (non-hydrolyzing) [Rhodospirillaceae bacterium]